MLKRKIPQEGESQFAGAVLRGDVREGDKVVMTCDRLQTPCSHRSSHRRRSSGQVGQETGARLTRCTAVGDAA
ncbi:hypothetical protein [Paraburkholderia sp. BL6665CI2N2]|uniref:hypothetical protein n=1 Tax=Paraburkholderia sp. BL6665CI2N2 TaxID=1938806 RepID=UPI001064E383|nr:hypothetical protein [Paraburkholderia sp. BL6665CI2N2]